MKLQREPIDVDLYVEHRSLTEKDRKEFLDFLENYKRKQKIKDKRALARKKVKATA